MSAVTYTTSGTTQPIGSLTQVTFGSSDYDTFSYDPNTGRLNQYKFYVGATPQTVTGNLTWNSNGSLGSLAITDQLNSANTQTCNYSRDDLGRIASANCGTPWNQTFSFDPFGNITKNATAGISFTPTYSQSTNRYSVVSGCTPSYDANGFATNDCAHTYSWDSAGNPLTIDTVGLTYDALGRMVEQARGSTYTQIVYGPGGGKLALMNGSTLSKAFVPLPGGGAAVYTSTGLTYYRHSDWLGSGRLATTPVTRAMYFDVAYGPYGENYAGSGSVDLDFTGQTQDTVSGIYDFLFREYNANHGRWPWPDPAGMGAVNMANPQSWNRYAYVAGNPLSLVDPLGLQSQGCVGKKWVCPDGGGGNPFWAFDVYGVYRGMAGWKECSANGVASVCSIILDMVRTGSAAVCPNNNCNAIRQDPDTGELEQIVGWQYRNVLGFGQHVQKKLVPIWGDIPDPNCQALFLDCNTPLAGNTVTSYVTADHSNWIQRAGDKINNWLMTSRAVAVFVCLTNPQGANDIADLSAQMNEHTDEMPEGAGGAAIWINNVNSTKNGGQSPYGNLSAATKANAAALGFEHGGAAVGCLGR